MKRLGLCAAVFILASCAGEPPAPLALPPPLAEPAPPPAPTAPAGVDAIVAAVTAVPVPDPAEAAPPARPPQTDAGQWCVVVVSERKARDTKRWTKRLTDAGYRVEVEPAEVGGTTWYRVLLPGYRADNEARAAVPAVNTAAGVNDAFVWRRKKAAPASAAPEERPAN